MPGGLCLLYNNEVQFMNQKRYMKRMCVIGSYRFYNNILFKPLPRLYDITL